MNQARRWVFSLIAFGILLPLSLVQSQEKRAASNQSQSQPRSQPQSQQADQSQPRQDVDDVVRKRVAPGQTGADLIEKAQTSGSVRVIVGLRVAVQPEGELGQPVEVQAQRRSIAQAQTALLDRLSAYRISSVKRFDYIPFIALEVDAVGLEALRNDAEVASIEEDAILHTTLAESVPLIGAPAAWASGYAGAGQAVAILDTGVDKTHPFLTGKVVAEACYSTNSSQTASVCPGGVSQSTASGSGVNCSVAGCEHGTHVAGIAAGKSATVSGVARDANIVAIQVFSRIIGCSSSVDCTGAFDSDILLGLQQVQQLSGSINIAAVNLSLGSGGFGANCDSSSPSFKAAIDNLRSVGIATVAASGNGGSNGGVGFPACISSAISVGSTGDGSNSSTVDAVSSFSDSASFLNLLAPGEWISSSVPGGGFSNFRGTSQAAPHVAGAWAVLKSKTPAASVAQTLQALSNTGLAITDPRNNIVKPRIRLDQAASALQATACNYSISPATQSVALAGGAGTVNVTASAGCAWTAASNVSWLTITSGASGSGAGTVGFTAAANTGLDRAGTLFIAGLTFVVTQPGAPVFAVDDGSFENASGLAFGGSSYRVNRLTPTSYPATINAVAIYFPSGTGVRVGDTLTVIAGVNPSGSSSIDGIQFLSQVSAQVQTLDQFNVYPIPGLAVNSGDFVVGMQINHASGVLPFAIDTTPPLRRRSYRSTNGTTFSIIDDIGTPGNYGFRALPSQSLTCSTVASINPTGGVVGSTVTVNGTGFTGVTSVKFNNNLPAQFTVVSDTQITATVPTGTIDGPITISKPNCADVKTGAFTIPTANLLTGTTTTTEVGGNGNTYIEPGENGSLSVQLRNTGTGPASAINATLTTTTTGVTITQGASAYPNIASPSGAATNTTPFAFSLSNTAACGLTINFTLTLNYAGGPTPKTLNFSVPTGIAISTVLDATPPTPGPGFITATGTQTGRLTRTFTSISCASSKSCPGLNDSSTRRYDAYTFVNSAAATTCFTVTLSPSCGTQLFAAAYLGGFDPSNLCLNYLSDAGDSGPRTFSFNVPAGANFTVTVNELDPGAGANCGYTLGISGLCGIANVACSTVTGISPSSGAVGSTVTITGTNFTGVNSVKFANNASAQFTIVSDTQITATVPSGAITGPITVGKTGCPTAQSGVFSLPTANLLTGTITAAEVGGNGNTYIEPGENGSLSVQLRNTGTGPASAINATLTTSTAGVTITQGASAYPDIASPSGAAANTTPFAFSLSNTAACGLTINFTLTLNYTGGPTPQKINFSVPTGGGVNINTVLDSTPPTPGPGFITATGTQTGRLSRNGVRSSCGSGKSCPTPNDSSTRRYDSYSFLNSGSATSCVTVGLTQSCSAPLYVQAYLGNFDPNNLCANFLADPGDSGPQTFSFNVPSGATFTVVVQELDPGTGSGCNYNINVGGLCTLVNTACPALTSVTPTSGVVGTSVTIAGANFTGVNSVKFANNVAAQFTVNSDTQITATVPSGAITGPITITKPGCPTAQSGVFSMLTPNLLTGTITAAEVGGNGNTYIEPGENGSLSVQLRNTGTGPATAINATLTTTTTGVTITQGASAYPDIASPSGAATNTTPFAFSLSNTAACGLTINFTLTLNYAGNSTPKTLNFSVPTGIAISTVLDATPPTPGPGFVTATGTQTGRLARTFTSISCAASKTCPGLYDSSTRRYDAYTFVNSAAATTCFTVTLAPSCGTQLFAAAYLGGFDPSNLCLNYLSDAGDSGPRSFSFNVPAGANFTVTVNEIDPGAGANCGYTLGISGLCGIANVACPTVAGINPSNGAVGSTVTITGTNFTGVNSVKFANNASAQFTINSDTQITATVPNGAVTGPITISKQGCNDAQTGAFTVVQPNPVPSLTSLNPNSAVEGSPGFTLTVTGSNFVNGAVVRWNNADRSTTFDSATQLRATITAQDIASAGAASVTVFNPGPGGGASNALNFTIAQTPRIVRVLAAGAPSGATVNAPIELVSQNDENAIGFSLSFDPAVLSNPQVALGSDAAGASLNVNTSQAAQGRVGLVVALPTGQKFAAGSRQVAVVSFTIAANTMAATTPINFSDQPVRREVVAVNGATLPARYEAGVVTIIQGYEADVSPRPNGNGTLTVSDWTQLGRFAVGLDTAANGNEFQRADCAPLATFGDGVISVADYVQAGRYAAGLDPIVAAGGPTAPNARLAADSARRAVGDAGMIKLNRASADVLVVECDARGGENAFGFSLNFDPAQWRFVSAEIGRDAAGAALYVNSSQAGRGRIGFALALPAGASLPVGARQIVIARFQSLSGGGASTIEFGDLPVRREAVDARANSLPATFMRQRDRRDEIGNRTIIRPTDPGLYRKRND